LIKFTSAFANMIKKIVEIRLAHNLIWIERNTWVFLIKKRLHYNKIKLQFCFFWLRNFVDCDIFTQLSSKKNKKISTQHKIMPK